MNLSVDLKHQQGEFTLDAAFEAPHGITVLYGPSGSGKTTIVNALAGLITPDAGRVAAGDWTIFDSAKGLSLPPHKRRIGYIFQEGRLFPHLTVRQNLMYGQWFNRSGASPASFNQIVDMLGISSLLTRMPNRLSGGEKQRVGIGRALLANPKLILADEPLAALDDARKEEILPYFERLRDEIDLPVLYVSHAGAEVARLATSVVVLKAGRVVKQGTAIDILGDPSVTPLGASAAGVVLHARVARHHPDGITELDVSGRSLLIPKAHVAPNATVRLRVEAQDVMIATQKPQGVSALNVLPVTISEIRMGDGPGALAQLSWGDSVLLARITRRSIQSLNLKKGDQVYAVLKAVSIPRGAIGDER